MLIEFRVVPIGCGDSQEWRDQIEGLLKDAGLPNERGALSICTEGEWPKVMDVIHRCHQSAFAFSSHVLTSITVNELLPKIASRTESVQESIGRRVPRKGMDTEC